MGQDLALFGRLMAEGEVARDHLPPELIHGVEQVGAPACDGVGDVDVRFDALHPSHPGGHDGGRSVRSPDRPFGTQDQLVTVAAECLNRESPSPSALL